jgi:predicted membrane chloride channel (bestrophin family)
MIPRSKNRRSQQYQSRIAEERTRRFRETGVWEPPRIGLWATLWWIVGFEVWAGGLAALIHYVIQSTEIAAAVGLVYAVLSIPIGIFVGGHVSMSVARYQRTGQLFIEMCDNTEEFFDQTLTTIGDASLQQASYLALFRIYLLMRSLPYAARSQFAHDPDPVESLPAYREDEQLRTELRRQPPGKPTAGVIISLAAAQLEIILRDPALKDVDTYHLKSALFDARDNIGAIKSAVYITVPDVYLDFELVLIILYLLLLPLALEWQMHWWSALIIQPVAVYVLMGMRVLATRIQTAFDRYDTNPFSFADILTHVRETDHNIVSVYMERAPKGSVNLIKQSGQY